MQSAPQSYGSDQSGLVCGYLFGRSADGKGQPLDTDAACAWLKEREQHPQEFIWLHYNLANTASEKWLHEHMALPEEFYESLHEGPRSTRIELADDTLIAVVNDVLHDFSFEPSDISTLWLSVDRQIVISARRKPLRAVDSLRNAVRGGEPIHSSVELLTHLLRDQADALIKIVRDAISTVDSIEDNLLAGKLTTKRASLGALRRVLVRLQRLLAPEPAALFRLLQKPPAWMAESDVQELRQSTEEFSMVLADMASLQERIKLIQEEIAALASEANNHSLFVLTVVTVLALPINIIAGLLGMNVGGIPLAQSAHGFLIVVVIVASFTVIAGWLAFRRQRDVT
ncbi:zinc transporter [Duganella sp. CF402]|uniref:transporter n=1 Tax=unclassified Duganella TaxID=2636909 RepID=UPI0008C70F71|nr:MULTISPECIES: transporter [unclassified Duganella]RZT10998.1 zinc transporter [Duganella sp. BK701]SEK86299.1 zinc transporter [Duganella sp. CF402]